MRTNVHCAAWQTFMQGAEMTKEGAADIVESTVRLVLEVARLGEADLRGWWSSHGLDREGSFVLKRAFPRTWQSVRLRARCAVGPPQAHNFALRA